MPQVVLHCDMNNYFASVECIDKPQLKQIPMAVCGDPAMRHGIVLAKNEPAKKLGIVTGESSVSALEKCAKLVMLPPDYPKYLKYARLARDIYHAYSDKIYPYGLDEAWIDLTDSCCACDKAIEIADEIRMRINESLKLTASVGVSFNYIFSKLASDMKKPDATSIVRQEELASTVWNLPAFDLLFVGSATRKILRNMGVLTIGDLARSNPRFLTEKLGKKGRMLWEFANGDDSSFDPCSDREEDLKSLGNTITPPKDITSREDAAAFLYLLSSTVSIRLKKHGKKANCVSVVIRSSDFSITNRQRTLSVATDNHDEIFRKALALFDEHHDWSKNIRSIGVKGEKLTDTVFTQLSFFGEEDASDSVEYRELVAKLEKRYGKITPEHNSDELLFMHSQ